MSTQLPKPPAGTEKNFNGIGWQMWFNNTWQILQQFFTSFNSIYNSQTQVIFPVQATTLNAPTYVKGGIYFDNTLNKLRVGGATGWETISSS